MIESLEFHLEMVDGSRPCFNVSDPETITQFLDTPKPPDFFSSTTFAVETSSRVTVLPSGKIATIDLVSAQPLSWKPHLGTSDGEIEEISREELVERLNPENWKDFDRTAGKGKGERFEGFVQIRLVSGSKRIVRSRTTTPPSMQQRMLLEPLLKRSMVFFPRLGGGLCFINTSAILRLDLLPGLPEIAPGALKGTEIRGQST